MNRLTDVAPGRAVDVRALAKRGSREAAAGVVAALVTLAGWLTVSLLAYAPLGAAGLQAGIPAACIAVAVGGLVVALLGRSTMPSAGLGSATVLIFASGVAGLAADPALAARGFPAIAACAALSVVLMGLLQWLLAGLRLGNVAKYVPHPVLAGFMNGVAMLVFLGQVPLLLGRTVVGSAAAPVAEPVAGNAAVSAWFGAATNLAPGQPLGPLMVGLATAGVAWLVVRRVPRAPGGLVGLVVGCALVAGLQQLWPSWWLGSTIGALPAGLPDPAGWQLLSAGEGWGAVLERHGPRLALTAALLAVVGSLETALNALSVDHVLLERSDPNRELFAFGTANIVSGVLGGLPVVYWRSRALAVRSAGGRGRLALAASAVATLLVYQFGQALIERLPLAVLGGIMLVVAGSLVDAWTRRTIRRAFHGHRSRELLQNLAVVAIVSGVTVWRGFVAGVALGVLLSVVIFIQAMNRSLVRSRYGADERPSRRLYPPPQEAVLGPLRKGIVVLELEGALFFGNAERLADEVARLGVRFVVFDVTRLGMLDESGAMALGQIAAGLARGGRHLIVAGTAASHRHGRALAATGIGFGLDDRAWFDDADQAVEAAERALLRSAGAADADAEIALDDCALLQGLAPSQRRRLCAVLERRELAAGELLFREGDAADRLYVLTRGSITVSSLRDATHGSRQRYLSFSAGMTFGETAMLDGRGRSADVIADVPSVVHALTRTALARLAEADPPLAQQVMTNIALHLSERLRHASSAWRQATG